MDDAKAALEGLDGYIVPLGDKRAIKVQWAQGSGYNDPDLMKEFQEFLMEYSLLRNLSLIPYQYKEES